MTTQTEDQDKFLNMSDEEMMNTSPPEVTQEVIPDEPVSNPQEKEVINEDATDDGDKETDEGETSAETQSEGLLKPKTDSVTAGDEETPEATKSVVEDKPEPEAVDYKAAYEKLFTPFKANGRDIVVKDVEDAISLMQMGANYNKKMAALKPNLKLMKLLENNGLLNEERLSYLIDLEKKNPEAISKLVKESGLDPLDLDADKAGSYKPNTYTVDDREMELDTVLDELQGTPTYNQTLSIVSNKWDGASKQVIAEQPQLLKVINSHVQSGIYDLISKEIESERMFGRLDGLSDIEAYRKVGDAIQARGGFNHLNPQVQTPAPKPVVVQPKPKNGDDEKLREKKRAAGSTKPIGAGQVKQDYNPLSLSDDAFSKLINEQYL